MRKLLIFTGLLCCTLGWTQDLNNVGSRHSAMFHMYYKKGIDFGYGYNMFSDNKEEILMSEGISQLEIKTMSAKGKLKYSEVKTFNSKGRLSSIEGKDKKIIYTYVDDTLLVKVEKITSGKKIIIEKSYDGKKLKSVNYKSNDEDIYSENYAFTSFGQIQQSKVVHHKKNRTYEMFYTYNDQNKLTLTEYKYNGKLIKSWNHECKPEGVDTKPQSETDVNVCKFNEEYSDGSYIVYTRRIYNESSSLQKDYFSKDSLLMKTEMFDNDSILQRRYIHNKNETITELYKKGELNNKHVERLNDLGMITEYTFFKKNKSLSCRKIIYNEDNTIASIEISHEGKLKDRIVYEYVKY